MIFGEAAFGSVPFMFSAVDASVAGRFDTLIKEQEATRSYLLIAHPYDVANSAEKTVYFSSGLESSILDVDGVLTSFPARLLTAVNFQTDIFASGILAPQQTSQSYGATRIHLANGDNDALTNYAWDGRAFSVLMGEPDYAYDEYRIILSGVFKDASWDEEVLTLSAEDKSGALSQQLTAERYTGQGYDAITAKFTGDAALTDIAKPFCIGQVLNIDPVLVDAALNVYQYHAQHAGDTTAVTGSVTYVYDMGVPLARINVADQQAVRTWTPVPGSFAVSPDGFIRLGAQPAGLITCDASVTVYYSFAGAYYNTVPSVIAYLVQNRLASPLTIDASSFASVASRVIDAAGFWAPDASQISVSEIVTRLLDSIGGYYCFNADGTFRIGIFDFSTPVLTLEQSKIISINREVTTAPSHSRYVNYAPIWRVQSESELAGGASSYHRLVVSRPYTTAGVSANSAAILARRKFATVTTFDSLCLFYAADEVARQAALLEPDRDTYTVDARRVQFRLIVGSTIRLTYPRFRLDRDFIVVGIVENSDTQTTTLKLWG